ncbi:uncharacterized protein C2845_PM04G00040 [Panicum miliaceum]|uniref:Uncharacterized protein n=1 Tax=Panicum miliaceum TaxID=4540 RepID=A0A3L6QN44_PANMI|nr:uncharacterized protein C2845_PM04G00040 [Panicum miliaceum]
MEEDVGRPEELLNSYVKLRMATGNITSGLGFLALLWSTVVLLGGLVSDLPMMQFWNHSNQLSDGMQYSSDLSLGLSVGFFVQRDYYGDAGVDIDKRAKRRTGHWPIKQVAAATNKQCGFEGWGSKVVRMYASETTRKFKKDWGLPDNWNLITYAVGLLQSASGGDDHLWGAMDTFFGKDDLPVRQELLSSKRSVQNLIAMIVGRGGTAGSIESRERAARIVARHLASHLHVTHFPGTLECIYSLLDPQDVTCPSEKPEESLPVPEQEDDQNRPLEAVVPIRDQNAGEQVVSSSSVGLVANRKRTSLRGWIKKCHEGARQRRKAAREERRFLDPKYRHPYESRRAKELISQGLLILERLTQDKVNCTEISRHQALVCMITSPLSSSHDLLSNVQDGTMVDMLSKSLTVLSRLLTSPGDGATRLRQELASNTEAVSNLMGIWESDSEGAQQLREQALEILTELGFDDSFTKPGSEQLTSSASASIVFNLVLHEIKSSKMGTSAGAATGAGASNSHGAAENVAGSQPPEEADSVQPHTQGNEKQSEERRFVAAMLSLAVAIRNVNVMSKEDFAGAIHEDAALVVIAMIQDEPSCIKRFSEHRFKESLTEALETMGEVDGCVLFAGNDRREVMNKPARSLASLVKEAQERLETAQEQGN